MPASTNVKDIIRQFSLIEKNKEPGMTVVFSTYQSIEVIAKAQKELAKLNTKFGQFDLIICDEAHRTTVFHWPAKMNLLSQSSQQYIYQGKKRLYMTATPRLYNDDTTKPLKRMLFFVLWMIRNCMVKKFIVSDLVKLLNVIC